jgi:hypothetical protein
VVYHVGDVVVFISQVVELEYAMIRQVATLTFQGLFVF